MVLLNLLGIVSSVFMLVTPLYLIRQVPTFRFTKHPISYLGTLKVTAKPFRIFLGIAGLLEYLFFLRLISQLGISNFRITTPILSLTVASTITATIYSSNRHPKVHYLAAISTFCSAGIGGLVFSLEYAYANQYSLLSLFGIVISVHLFASLIRGSKKFSIKAFDEFIFMVILALWNIIYTIALYR